MINSKIDKSYLAFTIPTLVIIFIITIIPFFMNFYYAVFRWDGININMKFVGLKNFVYIVTKDKKFINSVIFTLKFALFYISIVNILAFTFAYHLKKTDRLSTINRSLIYTPFIISMTAIGFTWKFILGPGFEGLHLSLPLEMFTWSWLGDPTLSFYSVLLVAIWQNVGFYMIIYIAGFQSIPKELYEAASIDGASGWSKLYNIVIPMMVPAITICTLTSMMYSLKLFDSVLVLTNGGPANHTNTIAFNIYTDAFVRFRFGMATAKSVLFFLGVLVLTIIQLKFMKSKEIK